MPKVLQIVQNGSSCPKYLKEIQYCLKVLPLEVPKILIWGVSYQVHSLLYIKLIYMVPFTTLDNPFGALLMTLHLDAWGRGNLLHSLTKIGHEIIIQPLNFLPLEACPFQRKWRRIWGLETRNKHTRTIKASIEANLRILLENIKVIPPHLLPH